MVSLSGEACRSKNRKPEARYSNPEVVHNSECDASSELTSEGETDEEEVQETPGSSGRRSATLNRTFLVPGSTDVAEASSVVMRTRQRIKPQRPLSFSGLSGTLGALSNSADGASARWAASETALNHLSSSPAHSPCLSGSRPLMCHASTQKDRLSPSTEGLGSSLAALRSSGSASAGGVRQRQRRHSARLRNMMSLSRRGDLDAQIFLGANDSNCVTLQSSRLSASAASASSSGESSSAGAGSQRSRRIVKSSTLTRIVDATVPLPIVTGPLVNAQSSPLKPPPPSTNSSPRSAPSDGELCLGPVDETSNFSEQAWDNYVVIINFMQRLLTREDDGLFIFLFIFRIAMLVKLTAKIHQMQRVLVVCWSLARITAMIWTAYQIAHQALAPIYAVSVRIICQNVHHPNGQKDSEWRIVQLLLNCAS